MNGIAVLSLSIMQPSAYFFTICYEILSFFREIKCHSFFIKTTCLLLQLASRKCYHPFLWHLALFFLWSQNSFSLSNMKPIPAAKDLSANWLVVTVSNSHLATLIGQFHYLSFRPPSYRIETSLVPSSRKPSPTLEE